MSVTIRKQKKMLNPPFSYEFNLKTRVVELNGERVGYLNYQDGERYEVMIHNGAIAHRLCERINLSSWINLYQEWSEGGLIVKYPVFQFDSLQEARRFCRELTLPKIKEITKKHIISRIEERFSNA